MRDGSIMQMHQANARRNALILGQFEFLQTRQESFERVVKVSTLRDRLKWLWNPGNFLKVVDAVQVSLLQDRQRKMESAAAKPKIEIVGANGAK